jgi:DNA-binding GntR family transcriptional regulator
MPPPAVPLYFRIQGALRAQIAAGAFGEGARLPSESELAEKFATTRGTVRQALAPLMFEGLIERRKGLGTFVASRPVESRIEAQRPHSFEEQMKAAGAQVGFRLIGFDAEPASSSVTTALELTPDTVIYRLRRLRLVEGEVIGFEDRSMLERIGASIPASSLATQSAVAIAELALGAPLGGMTVSVGAIAVRGETARHLGLRSGSPALVRAHTFFDPAGRPILAGESIYRGDKYRFTYRFGSGE